MAVNPNHAIKPAPSRLASAAGGADLVYSQKVGDYLRSRPDYPAALLAALRAEAGLDAGAQIADIGAGTGLLTRALLLSGYRVVAVEPNMAMRAAADSQLSSFPTYRSLATSAEYTGLANGSVSLITAAQAFHWFDAAQTRAECLRILRPRGKVALIWNDRVLDDPLNIGLEPLLAKFGASYRSLASQHEERRDVPSFFGGAQYQQSEFAHEHPLDRDGFEALVFSRSYMPSRETASGLEAAAEVSALFESLARNGKVTMHYRTILILGRPASQLCWPGATVKRQARPFPGWPARRCSKEAGQSLRRLRSLSTVSRRLQAGVESSQTKSSIDCATTKVFDSVRALLDVNVLIGLVDADHVHHEHVWAWFLTQASDSWASCPLTQNGFLRIMSQPKYPNPVGIRELFERLTHACQAPAHEFWPDEISLLDESLFDRTKIHSASQLTDLYLLALAIKHDAKFVTLDRSISLAAVRGAKPINLVLV